MTVSASAGFYEFGLSNWLNKGYQNGFSGGSNSTLIKTVTFVGFEPNQTRLTVNRPLYQKNVNLSYSLFVGSANSSLQPGKVRIDVSAISGQAFSTGYRYTPTGTISRTVNETELSIDFTANPNNVRIIILEFNDPLMILPR